ncbi:32641_t:CDS:2, partial [Gigaspora margarita]
IIGVIACWCYRSLVSLPVMSLICGCWHIWISSFAYGSSLNSRDRNDKLINDFTMLVRKPNARIVYFDPEEHIAIFLFAFVFVSSVIYRLHRLDPTFVGAVAY